MNSPSQKLFLAVVLLCSTASGVVSLPGFVNAVAPHPIEGPGETNDMQWELRNGNYAKTPTAICCSLLYTRCKEIQILAVSLRHREKIHIPQTGHLTLLFMPEC